MFFLQARTCGSANSKQLIGLIVNVYNQRGKASIIAMEWFVYRNILITFKIRQMVLILLRSNRLEVFGERVVYKSSL